VFEEDEEEDESPNAPLKLAIVGRPNAGKSTLVNQMLGEDRMITGPEAGITRDSISIEWEWTDEDGTVRPVRLVDTAGLRKKSKVDDKLERLSAADTRRAIDFAEVVVLLLDASRGLEAQDLRIADQVYSEGRAIIIALNKWDIVEHGSALLNGVRKALDDGFAQVRGIPLLTVSAATGKGVDLILKVAFETREAWSRRVPTASSTAGLKPLWKRTRRPHPAASGSSCVTPRRSRRVRPASSCSARVWISCRKAIAATSSTGCARNWASEPYPCG
jgi:GTP-binding protein